jgi:hypothetical protein
MYINPDYIIKKGTKFKNLQIDEHTGFIPIYLKDYATPFYFRKEYFIVEEVYRVDESQCYEEVIKWEHT